jgi:hypothetical protein
VCSNVLSLQYISLREAWEWEEWAGESTYDHDQTDYLWLRLCLLKSSSPSTLLTNDIRMGDMMGGMGGMGG